MNFRFSLTYFLLSVLIFGIEYLIATVFKDIVFVRAYLGDVIVVWLLYTLVLTVVNFKNKYTLANGILLFSFAVETAQYFKLAEKLGYTPGSIMYILIGNSFSWWDMLCYLVGVMCLWLVIFWSRKWS